MTSLPLNVTIRRSWQKHRSYRQRSSLNSRSVTAWCFWNAKPKGRLFFSIGIYAYKGFALYCHLQRIKRKIEPVQGYLNRDEAVILPAVDDLHTGIFLGFPYFFTKQLKSA